MSFPFDLIFIVGPTAVGKSDLAFQLAKQINAEIVSCDSMQVYKEISIASNKPSTGELKDVPHHLVDVVSIEEEFDVVRFNDLAGAAIKEIISRKRIPIVVGGSGMYVQILLDGIFKSKPKDSRLRQQLQDEIKQYGSEYLYKKLKSVDVKAAEKIHPHDTRRIIRALEVYETQNKRLSDLQPKRSGLWDKYKIAVYGLDMERKVLYDQIDRRVEKMFKAGVVDEIRSLQKRKWSYTADRLIGVKEVMQFLKKECSLDEAKELMKKNTRNFAKRQLTWFRKEQRIKWLELDGDFGPKNALEYILNELEKYE